MKPRHCSGPCRMMRYGSSCVELTRKTGWRRRSCPHGRRCRGRMMGDKPMRIRRAACRWRIARVAGRQVRDCDTSPCMLSSHRHRAVRYRPARKQRCERGTALRRPCRAGQKARCLARPPASGRRWEGSLWPPSKREAGLTWLGDLAQSSCQVARPRGLASNSICLSSRKVLSQRARRRSRQHHPLRRRPQLPPHHRLAQRILVPVTVPAMPHARLLNPTQSSFLTDD